jgi:exodeoxyribonuclease-3
MTLTLTVPPKVTDRAFARLADMRIATFNINGIKARMQALSTGWTRRPMSRCCRRSSRWTRPFRASLFEDKGYNVETHGQKGFNGVAILSKLPLEDVSRGLPGDDSDEQARWIEATVVGDGRGAALRALPAQRQPRAGAEIRLQARLDGADEGTRRALWNRDAGADAGGRLQRHPAGRGRRPPEAWREDALPCPRPRRVPPDPEPRLYRGDPRPDRKARGSIQFWDYQAGAWDRNNGIRIDHVLMTRRRPT